MIPRNQLYDWGFRVGSATRANHKVAYLHRFCTILRQRRRRSSSNPCRSRLAQMVFCTRWVRSRTPIIKLVVAVQGWRKWNFCACWRHNRGSKHKVGYRHSRSAGTQFCTYWVRSRTPSIKLTVAIQGWRKWTLSQMCSWGAGVLRD